MQSTDSVSATEHWEDVASIASDYDVLAGSILGLSAPPSPQPVPCRAIRCEAAGTLIVKTVRGVNRTLHFAAGETIPCKAVTLVASGSSGCVPITVMY